MASLATMRLAVGSRLGVTIAAASLPTQAQVDAWLLEAAYKICDKAKDEHLESNKTISNEALSASDIVIDISGYTRYARSVALAMDLNAEGYKPAFKVKSYVFNYANEVHTQPFYKGDISAPIYSVIGTDIKFAPAATDEAAEANHLWIQYPTDASGMDDKFANIIVEYATMMAEMQDEEAVDAQIFGQIFEKDWGSYRGL